MEVRPIWRSRIAQSLANKRLSQRTVLRNRQVFKSLNLVLGKNHHPRRVTVHGGSKQMNQSSLALSTSHWTRSLRRDLSNSWSTAQSSSKWCESQTWRFQAVLTLNSRPSRTRNPYQLSNKTSPNWIRSSVQQRSLPITHRTKISTSSIKERHNQIMWAKRWTWHWRQLQTTIDQTICLQ